MNIRPATIRNAEALAALHRRCFETAWNTGDFEIMLAEPNGKGLMALLGETVTGCILYRAAADEAEILTIFVAPEKQRQGIGKALLAHCLANLKQAGIVMLYLEAPENSEAALSLYESSGFRRSGRRKDYYLLGGKKVDALLMEHRL